jgi:hypothetical protein
MRPVAREKRPEVNDLGRHLKNVAQGQFVSLPGDISQPLTSLFQHAPGLVGITATPVYTRIYDTFVRVNQTFLPRATSRLRTSHIAPFYLNVDRDVSEHHGIIFLS